MHTDMFCNGQTKPEFVVDNLSDEDGSLVIIKIGRHVGGATIFVNETQARDLADKILNALRVDVYNDTLKALTFEESL